MFDHDCFYAESGPSVLGLDLSLTAAAAVAIPVDWNGDFRRVASLVVGQRLQRDSTDEERARRTETIATRIAEFGLAHGATRAHFESYAFSRHDAAHALGELGGVTRLTLLNAGIQIRTANLGSARRLLLGKVPRSDVKLAVFATVLAAGGRFDTTDETDAFCAANFGLSELGSYFFAQAVAA